MAHILECHIFWNASCNCQPRVLVLQMATLIFPILQKGLIEKDSQTYSNSRSLELGGIVAFTKDPTG